MTSILWVRTTSEILWIGDRSLWRRRESPLRGIRLPRSAFRDLYDRENPYKPLFKAVPTSPPLEDPGVPAKTVEIEKVLQSLNISSRTEEAANSKEPTMEGQEEG